MMSRTQIMLEQEIQRRARRRAEALERYLETQGGRTNAIQSALALKGSMRETEAAALLSRTQGIRANWR